MTSVPGALPAAHEVVESALASSTCYGCVVVVEESSQAEVRFANNITTTNGIRRDRRVTVASIVSRGRGGDGDRGPGLAVGTATRSGAVDVADLVAASEADARRSDLAQDSAPLVAPSPDVAAFTEPAPETGMPALGGVLAFLAEALPRSRGEGRVLAGFAEHSIDTVYLGTSTGLRRRHVQPTGNVHLVTRSADGSRSAWAGSGAPEMAEADLRHLEERLLHRFGWARRRLELPAGRYETLLPPDAVADLMVPLIGAASGKEAEDGQSVFSAPGGKTKVGDKLSSLPFCLRSDPDEPGLECAPFVVATASGPDTSVFDNGLGLSRTDWIREGRLRTLRYHRAAASRSGVEPAPGADNLVLELPGSSGSLDDIIAGTGRGLLLTCLWYIREVDPSSLLLTGLTRDGIFLVEHGEVTGAVNNFRFNESPVDLLGRSSAAGRTERALSREWGEWWNRTAMPALRVAEFNMSSVSPST